jgi:hypothetical protein
MAASFIAEDHAAMNMPLARGVTAEFSSASHRVLSETRQLMPRFRVPVASCFAH